MYTGNQQQRGPGQGEPTQWWMIGLRILVWSLSYIVVVLQRKNMGTRALTWMRLLGVFWFWKIVTFFLSGWDDQGIPLERTPNIPWHPPGVMGYVNLLLYLFLATGIGKLFKNWRKPPMVHSYYEGNYGKPWKSFGHQTRKCLIVEPLLVLVIALFARFYLWDGALYYFCLVLAGAHFINELWAWRIGWHTRADMDDAMHMNEWQAGMR
ncbi:MAG: hypothetical protein L0Z53_27215 [Acidobacteriales bacterium]|nr:hypothetical protein [Terriglobales bacterium]